MSNAHSDTSQSSTATPAPGANATDATAQAHIASPTSVAGQPRVSPCTRRCQNSVLAGILVLSALAALWHLGQPSFNVDEAFSIVAARLNPKELFGLLQQDSHPPLFYLLLKAWLPLMALFPEGAQEFVGRLLTVACHVGCVALVYLWGRDLSQPNTSRPDLSQPDAGQPGFSARCFSNPITHAGLYAAILALCSSWAICRSHELRQYAPLALLVWLALYFCSRRQWVAYALATAASLLLHYNALLLLPVPWLAAAMQTLYQRTAGQPSTASAPPVTASNSSSAAPLPAVDEPSIWKALFFSQGAALLAFACWIPSFIAQYHHGQGTSTLLTESVFSHSVATYVLEVFAYLAVGAQSGLPHYCLTAGAIILAGLALWGWHTLSRRNTISQTSNTTGQTNNTIGQTSNTIGETNSTIGQTSNTVAATADLILLGVFLPVLIAVAAYFITGRGLISGKHMHFIYPGLYLLAGQALATLSSLRATARATSTTRATTTSATPTTTATSTHTRGILANKTVLPLLLALFLIPNARSWHTNTYEPTYQNPPWREIAHTIDSQAQPGDAILVITGYQSLALAHYHTGDIPIYPFTPEYATPEGAERLIRNLTYNHPRVWLVRISANLEDPRGLTYRSCNAAWHNLAHATYPNIAPFDQVFVDVFLTRTPH